MRDAAQEKPSPRDFAAETLNVSRYFNRDRTFTDNVAPSVTLTTTSATPTPVNGQLQVSFQASDTSGLALAWLMRNGNVVGAVLDRVRHAMQELLAQAR